MADAATTYRVWMALSVAAATAATWALGSALDALTFHAALRRAASGSPSLLEILLAFASTGVGLVGAVAIVRGMHALTAQVRAARCFSLAARGLPRRVIDGVETVLFVSAEPTAFCAGLRRAQIFVSTGALAHLSDGDLAAVIAHEHHHVRRRDPLRMALLSISRSALFFVPGLSPIAAGYGGLAELDADVAAEARAGRQSLASALLALGDVEARRVDRLTGERLDPIVDRRATGAAVVGVAMTAAPAIVIGVVTGCLDYGLVTVPVLGVRC